MHPRITRISKTFSNNAKLSCLQFSLSMTRHWDVEINRRLIKMFIYIKTKLHNKEDLR